MTWFTLVVDGLAVYRLTRLIVEDGITEPIRDWIIGPADGTREWWLKLLTCRYCVGMWAAFGVVLARWAVPDVWQWAAYVFAVACFAPLVARLEDD